MPRLRLAALAGALVTACLLVPAAAAHASFTVTPSTSQAAAATQVDIQAGFASSPTAVTLHLPPGLVGNPGPFAQCAEAGFRSGTCPAGSRVGDATADGGLASGGVFNLVPHADEPARLGISVGPLGIPIAFNEAAVTLRPDGGLDSTIAQLDGGGLSVTSLGLSLYDTFMTMPTSCRTAVTTIEAPPNPPQSASFTPTGCPAVPFAPGASLAVTDTGRTRPSGYTVGLTVPDGGSPRQAHVRRAQVVLPPGTTLSPGVAQGLEACSPQQFGAPGAPAGCPAASQIGTVSFDTPLIGTLSGKAFFGTPAGGAYPLLVAVDQHGVRIKLTGAVTLDPATGRITTVFDDLPQVPFTSFALSFQGGDRAVLANPGTCGSKALAATLTPWSGNAAKTVTAGFTVTGCPKGGIPFRPSLQVASDSTAAGRPAGALSITIARPDGDQDISRVETLLPPGLAASLSGVPMCAESAAATGACPAETRLGSVSALVGTGGKPVPLSGGVFLTGPAEGGLAGLAIVLPGKVGPVDLGTVVVRAGLLLRPADGGVTVRTSSLPALVGGVPVSVRSLTLRLDRPGFALNPSSCAAQTVRANVTAAGGATAVAQAPYRATDCGGLAFMPRLAATLAAAGPAGARRRPTFTTVLTVPPGQAATSSTHVKLPDRFTLDTTAIKAVCSLDQQAADGCPAASRVGTVTAQTPLLPVPLGGPVYLAAMPGQLLPGLRLALGGPVQLRLSGGLTLGHPLVAVFDGIPDVPLSRLELTFSGGGPLKVLGDPCTGSLLRATGELTGHNGASATAPARVRLLGCAVRATARRTTLDVRKGRDGKRLTRLRITLPRALRAGERVRATADGHAIRGRARGRRIALGLNRASHVVVRFARGVPRGRFVVRATRVGGAHSTVRLRAARLR